MSISAVVEKQLCTGCGACSYMEPERFRMVNSFELGRRPVLKLNAVSETGDAAKICPGASLTHTTEVKNNPEILTEMFDAWGPIYAVWEGYSADQGIRLAGSSGGAASALAMFCLEKQNMSGVLHTSANKETPYLNESVMSVNRGQLLERTGSRYSPASPCDALNLIEQSEKPCVFIGKPCDVAAVQQARKLRPALDQKVGVTIGFFCAGVPAFNGLFALLKQNGLKNPKNLKSLRFRGNGWPGLWTAKFLGDDGTEKVSQMTYADSWGFLQKYRQWRCYICPDHTGEFADIAVGDPWYREVQPGEAGKSLIIARTKRGLEIIKAAAEAGYIVLETQNAELLPLSQPNLYGTRGTMWARLNVLRLMGAGVPRYEGFTFFKFWLQLGLKLKVTSHLATVKRVFAKRLNKKTTVQEWTVD